MTIRHKRNTLNIFALVMKSHLEKRRIALNKQSAIVFDMTQRLEEEKAKLAGLDVEVAMLEGRQ